MNIIDLTHFISSNIPVYPETEPPKIHNSNTITKNSFAEKTISISSHTGTHIDAPAHMVKGASSLDMFNLDHFRGKGCVINISGLNKKIIEAEDIKADFNTLDHVEFILFFTGWSRFWNYKKYLKNYPVLSEKLVGDLTKFKLKGIGLDTISIDPVGSVEFPNHMKLFRKNIIIIENLNNLDSLFGKEFTFLCMPLKISNLDGSPVRACAIID